MSSKLEKYVGILKVLAQKGPLEVSHLIQEENISNNILKGSLGFLIKQRLIEERVLGESSVVYANTARGTSVIKFFKEIDKKILVKEEDGKFLPVPY